MGQYCICVDHLNCMHCNTSVGHGMKSSALCLPVESCAILPAVLDSILAMCVRCCNRIWWSWSGAVTLGVSLPGWSSDYPVSLNPSLSLLLVDTATLKCLADLERFYRSGCHHPQDLFLSILERCGIFIPGCRQMKLMAFFN
jgi:hypothetical protein